MGVRSIMTLTFDLWPWESLQPFTLTWWMFLFHWSHSTKQRDVNGRPDVRPENNVPPPPVVGGCTIKQDSTAPTSKCIS